MSRNRCIKLNAYIIIMSPWSTRGSFYSCRMRKQCLCTHCSRAFSTSCVFFAQVVSSWRKKLPSTCTICKRQAKYLCISCGKSVCVRVECSIAEEHTLEWEANRSIGYCLPCAGTAAGAGQNEFCSEKPSPFWWHGTNCSGKWIFGRGAFW